MAKRVTAKTWVKNNRGCETDVHELCERITERVNPDEPLYKAAYDAATALAKLDTELEKVGWND